jgi:hypothetical protein
VLLIFFDERMLDEAVMRCSSLNRLIRFSSVQTVRFSSAGRKQMFNQELR